MPDANLRFHYVFYKQNLVYAPKLWRNTNSRLLRTNMKRTKIMRTESVSTNRLAQGCYG